jgi:hypothetical protein
MGVGRLFGVVSNKLENNFFFIIIALICVAGGNLNPFIWMLLVTWIYTVSTLNPNNEYQPLIHSNTNVVRNY